MAAGCTDTAKIIRRKFQNGNARPEEILLVANVLIGGDKEIELVNSQRQQCAVLCSSPPSSLNAGAIVSAEEMAHGPRDSFVQSDPHAGASSTASERSRTRHAISRVTDGKHSRNSS